MSGQFLRRIALPQVESVLELRCHLCASEIVAVSRRKSLRHRRFGHEFWNEGRARVSLTDATGRPQLQCTSRRATFFVVRIHLHEPLMIQLPIINEAALASEALESLPLLPRDGRHAEPLPMSMAEARQRGWDEVDIVFVTGDAYIDHPSFAMAILGRVLEAAGFRVGIVSQPDWRTCEPWREFGKPRLFFAIAKLG